MTTEEIGLTVNRFDVSPPSLDNTTESIAGRHGNIDLGSTFEPREIELEGFFKSYDINSFPMYRDRLFKMFASQQAIYLVDSRQPWKRWFVKLNGTASVDRIPLTRYGEVNMSFITMGMPFATSSAKSIESRKWKDNGWFWGGGIYWDDEDFVYGTTSFSVPNYGDFIVNPRFMELRIIYNGASTGLKIENLTTGDDWEYSGTTIFDDQILIDGIRSFKNGSSIIRDTNKHLITLAPGKNEFRLTGTSGNFNIIFDFRFAYL